MISDEELKKTLQECLDDPVFGDLFKNLFVEMLKLYKRMEKEEK